MIRIWSTILLCAFATKGWSQQLPLFTQYRDYQTVLNPAAVEGDYLAFGQALNFGLSYRAQWTGISGNPQTQVLRGSYFWDDYSGVTLQVGGHLLNDQTGPTGMTGLYGRIAGVISGDPAYGGLSIGLTIGIVQYRVNASKIRLQQSGDILGDQNQTQWFPDVGLGLFYYKMLDGPGFNGNVFYAGFSVPQLLGLDITFQQDDGSFALQRIPHFYGQAGFLAFLTEDSFLEPSVWLRYLPDVPFSADFNLRYQLPLALWVGVGGSTQKSVHLETGVWLGDRYGFSNSFRIGYGYDHYFSSIGPRVGGTHEINLSMSFDR